jgi:hypothetical protein
MLQERQLNVFLGNTRWWMTAFIMLHAVVIITLVYNATGQFFDTCGDRADCTALGTCQNSFDYWKVKGSHAIIAIVPGVSYWGLWHVLHGTYFWIGFMTALAGFGYTLIQSVLMIPDIINCDNTTWCYGCTTLLSGVPVDEAFLRNIILSWFNVIFCFIYIFLQGFLRSQTEFGFLWWINSEVTYNAAIKYVPTPFAWGHTDSPAGMSSIDFEIRRAFRIARTVVSIKKAIALCAWIVMGWNFGNLLINTCELRFFSWEYIRLFSPVIGLGSVYGGYWFIWHLIYEFWYLAAAAGSLIIGLYLLIDWALIWVIDVENCVTTSWCTGCPLIAGQWDWPFTLHLWMLGILWVDALSDSLIVLYFRSKVGEGQNQEALESPNYPGAQPNVPLVNSKLGNGGEGGQSRNHSNFRNEPIGEEMVIGNDYNKQR